MYTALLHRTDTLRVTILFHLPPSHVHMLTHYRE